MILKEYFESLGGSDYVYQYEDLKVLDGAECREFGTTKGFTLHFCPENNSLYAVNWRDGENCDCSIGHRHTWYLASEGRRNGFPDQNLSGLIEILSPIKGSRKRAKAKKVETPEEKVIIRNLPENKKKAFYTMFQIGIEVEGEFFFDREDIDMKSSGYFSEDEETMHGDGSLSARNGGTCVELVTPIIRGIKDEKEFIGALESISKGSGKRRVFAYNNPSAGTHVHVDFSPLFYKKLRKEIGYGENNLLRIYGENNLLRIFDSLEFERYFFREYFRAFKLPKFWDRLSNSYCKSFITASPERKVAVENWSSIENRKEGNDRYRWLNMQSLDDDTGIEFRIFPCIQTARGMEKVISFMQKVLLTYIEKKKKEHFAIIKSFYEASPLDVSKMSKEDRIIYDSLRVESKMRDKAYRTSFDIMVFFDRVKKRMKK